MTKEIGFWLGMSQIIATVLTAVLWYVIAGDETAIRAKKHRKSCRHWKNIDIGKMPVDWFDWWRYDDGYFAENRRRLEKCPHGVGSLDLNVETLTKKHRFWRRKRRR